MRIWFGEWLMGTYAAEPVAAERYVRDQAHRFPGLTVSIDDHDTTGLPALPCEQLWILAP